MSGSYPLFGGLTSWLPLLFKLVNLLFNSIPMIAIANPSVFSLSLAIG